MQTLTLALGDKPISLPLDLIDTIRIKLPDHIAVIPIGHHLNFIQYVLNTLKFTYLHPQSISQISLKLKLSAIKWLIYIRH